MITIVGAGMAGLLAGSMIRDHIIYEEQPALPNNHHAVLRFRSSIVGDTLNIPFKRVQMMKCIHPWRNPVADQLAYSLKANGTARLRSAISASGELAERYVAPPNLIERMAAMCNITFNEHVSLVGWKQPVISTIPMPALMQQLGWAGPQPNFQSRDGWVLWHKLRDVDAYCSVYDPDPSSSIYRASVTGDKLQAECIDIGGSAPPSGLVVSRALELLGLTTSNLVGWPDMRRQKYAKIVPIDDDVRKRFIIWASEEHNVYSLGRFATWRPGLLLDDVVNDVRVIQRLINGGSSYHHKLR